MPLLESMLTLFRAYEVFSRLGEAVRTNVGVRFCLYLVCMSSSLAFFAALARKIEMRSCPGIFLDVAERYWKNEDISCRRFCGNTGEIKKGEWKTWEEM